MFKTILFAFLFAMISSVSAVVPKSVDRAYLLEMPDGSTKICAHRSMDEDSVQGWLDLKCQTISEKRWQKCLANQLNGDTLCHDVERRSSGSNR